MAEGFRNSQALPGAEHTLLLPGMVGGDWLIFSCAWQRRGGPGSWQELGESQAFCDSMNDLWCVLRFFWIFC